MIIAADNEALRPYTRASNPKYNCISSLESMQLYIRLCFSDFTPKIKCAIKIELLILHVDFQLFLLRLRCLQLASIRHNLQMKDGLLQFPYQLSTP